jgi:hypothetical protein
VQNGSIMSIEQFRATPKLVTETYKGIIISAQFNPDNGLWHWRFELPSHIVVVEDDSISLNAAMRAAKKKVDKVNGET